jgi:hypothetical protein
VSDPVAATTVSAALLRPPTQGFPQRGPQGVILSGVVDVQGSGEQLPARGGAQDGPRVAIDPAVILAMCSNSRRSASCIANITVTSRALLTIAPLCRNEGPQPFVSGFTASTPGSA